MNKSKLVASGLLLAVFVSGLIVGGAANALADREERNPRRARRPYTEVLRDTLGLSNAQHDSIETILHGWRTSVRELYDERDRRIGEIRKDTREEIISVLDEPQSDLYQQMIARDDSIRAERSNRRRK